MNSLLGITIFSGLEFAHEKSCKKNPWGPAADGGTFDISPGAGPRTIQE
jgi:hypothetical protein